MKRKAGNQNWKWKNFSFLFFSLFETTKICLGCTKMETFYREKAYFTPAKKIGKSDFASCEKYSCYATVFIPFYLVKKRKRKKKKKENKKKKKKNHTQKKKKKKNTNKQKHTQIVVLTVHIFSNLLGLLKYFLYLLRCRTLQNTECVHEHI